MTEIVATAEQQRTDRTVFGFWVYLMTDCVLFASLFATFAVLRNNTLGGPSGQDIFDMPYVLVETLLLLTSSFICGLALLAAKQGKKTQALALLAATSVLGLSFLVMELAEFAHLASAGHGWQHSAFLSAFFTLVGTHGLHITAGLIWMFVLMLQILRRGLPTPTLRRLTMMSMFWHFLDVIWIFIFTIVYLMGVA
jgi:cytochrome o ubiquinol oxidase subunit 3